MEIKQKKLTEINKNWNTFLNVYYHQPCIGCKNGHSSFWRTIIESREWKKWKKYNFKKSLSGNWDFSENEELGILSEGHWKAFVKFLKIRSLLKL